MSIAVKIQKLEEDALPPKYGRPGDAGLDIHSYESCVILPGERKILRTAIALAIPQGTVGHVWDRSGMAAKHGIKTMAGVLDHTYRGELKIVLLNTSQEEYQVEKGDRIAQLVVQPVHTAELEVVDELDETVRGDGHFGSSGK